MRKYRVNVRAKIGTMQTSLMAESYQDAKKKAEDWANDSYLHAKYGPWECYDCEVAA